MKIILEQKEPKIQRILDRLAPLMRQEMGREAWEVAAGAEGVLNILKKLTPSSAENPAARQTDKGHIRDYWTAEAKLGAEGFIETITILNTHPNAAWLIPILEYGSRRHAIKGNPYLHFKTASGNWVKTTKIIEHPGTDPYHMLRDSKEIMELLVAQATERVLQMFINQVEQG